MSRKSERVLKGVLFTVIAVIVGAGFYFAGPAGGIWFAVIAALLLWSVFVERTRRCPYEDDSLDMIGHPVWKHWQGNIWHKKG
ncbi:MAG: hypothetical protein P1P84_25465 [Deferrisomatales bacterium]|nr:hypothetical protein [Deferrisomatales bacterium]